MNQVQYFNYYMDQFIDWIDPWFWLVASGFVFFLALLGVSPIQVETDSRATDILLIKIRQILMASLFMVIGVAPLTLFLFSLFSSSADAAQAEFVLSVMGKTFLKYWTALSAALLSGYVLGFMYERYIVPHISSWFHRIRVRQSGDALSDIRAEKARLNSKNFLPTKYYKKDMFFMGIDERDKPVYIPDKTWKTWNQKIIGPTQTGKGVHIGVQVDQAIRKNMTVIIIDPKPDAHLEDIMRQACEGSGRALVSLDLNHSGQGKWAPFAGGAMRDIRSRLMYAFGLMDSGDESDFYKAAEREVIDKLLPNWDGQLDSLKKDLQEPRYKDVTKRVLSYLGEWMTVDTFNPRKGRGFSVARSLENNAVVYVRSSLDDPVVVKAATVLIMEVVQELRRLYKEKKRDHHLFFAIDEVRFMISDMLADALATVVGFNANLMIAYQSIKDLRGLKDKSLDPDAIEESVNVNCKLTLCYMAANTETAEWAAEMSGIVQKSIGQFEQVRVTKHGAEVWGDQRMLAKAEENYISSNVMRMLPERVGVMFVPNELARLVYTCWIPVTHRPPQPKIVAPKEPAPAVIAERVIVETPKTPPARSVRDTTNITQAPSELATKAVAPSPERLSPPTAPAQRIAPPLDSNRKEEAPPIPAAANPISPSPTAHNHGLTKPSIPDVVVKEPFPTKEPMPHVQRSSPAAAPIEPQAKDLGKEQARRTANFLRAKVHKQNTSSQKPWQNYAPSQEKSASASHGQKTQPFKQLENQLKPWLNPAAQPNRQTNPPPQANTHSKHEAPRIEKPAVTTPAPKPTPPPTPPPHHDAKPKARIRIRPE